MHDLVHQHWGGWNTVNHRGCGWVLCTVMVILHKSVSYRSCHPWITYMCIPSCTSFSSYKIQSHKYSTLVMWNFGYLVNMAALLVSLLGVSVTKVDIYGVKKKGATSGIILQVMLELSLCIPGPCIFHISCGTRSKLS